MSFGCTCVGSLYACILTSTHPPTHTNPHTHAQVVVDGIGGVCSGGHDGLVGSPGAGGNDLVGAMAHEIALIRSLCHPHIVRYLGAHRCGGCLNIMLGVCGHVCVLCVLMWVGG